MIQQTNPHIWARREIQAAHDKCRRLLSGQLEVTLPPSELFGVRTQLSTLCTILGCMDQDCTLLMGQREQWQVLPFAWTLELVDQVDTIDREIRAANEQRICRQCGCTEEHACVDAELGPCWWIEEDLCSHCLPMGAALRLARAGTLWDGEFREEKEPGSGEGFPLLSP